MKDLKSLYERLRALPWPPLAKSIGHFPLYDSLLAGCADRVVQGGHIDGSEVPVPDDETVRRVHNLREKGELSPEEKAFLEYFNLLEEIRTALGGEKSGT